MLITGGCAQLAWRSLLRCVFDADRCAMSVFDKPVGDKGPHGPAVQVLYIGRCSIPVGKYHPGQGRIKMCWRWVEALFGHGISNPRGKLLVVDRSHAVFHNRCASFCHHVEKRRTRLFGAGVVVVLKRELGVTHQNTCISKWCP